MKQKKFKTQQSRYRKIVFATSFSFLSTFFSNSQHLSVILPVHAAESSQTILEQSGRWDQSRIKRTVAIKAMEQKGMIKVDTDDSGNQFISLPWNPNRKVPYKSLSMEQQLLNEVCAGAFGELTKDVLLHSVDTSKTRRQMKNVRTFQSFQNLSIQSYSYNMKPIINSLRSFKDLYAGFPIVLVCSIPQGGTFFLVKKSLIEVSNKLSPGGENSLIGQAMPIGMAVMAYWMFRTPAEVLKTQVQIGRWSNIREAIQDVKMNSSNGFFALWKHYNVMLSLDIPFQIVNFILYGSLTDTLTRSGVSSNIWTRLFCGALCGMISAGLTCPIDVCKTRIISRDKESPQLRKTMNDEITTISVNNSEIHFSDSNSNVLKELTSIYRSEGISALFLGIRQRLVYTGLANGIRLAAYGTSRMDLMVRSLDTT